jgi:mono/diheme cytochrome c family protein
MTTESQSAQPSASMDGEGPLHAVLAEYETPGELIEAAKVVRDAGYTKWDCHSPFPVHGLDPAMGIRPTILPWLVFGGGLAGMAGTLLLVWWMNAHNWPWIVAGMPQFSLPANIPPIFEGTILLAGLTAFFGVWALNRLPKLWNPLFKSERFAKATDDGFFIAIEASDPQFERAKTEAMLVDAGARGVEAIHLDADPRKWQVPKPIFAFIIVTAVLSLVPFAFISKARATHGTEPMFSVFLDMYHQPKAKSQAPSPVFADGRASRMPVEGTVARGQLRDDDHFYRGIDGGEWATTFPTTFEVTPEAMERGQVQFDVFCAPCHGFDGQGNGPVHQRADRIGSPSWLMPTNIHDEYVVIQPHGQLFNTISHGIRSMPGYRAQIEEDDRWAIVLYMRALQRSQKALPSDVPPEQRARIR